MYPILGANASRLQGENMKYLKMLGLAAVAAAALMAFVGAGTASATTLEVGGVVKNSALAIEGSLKTGTSALLKDEFGTTTDTCTVSGVKGNTEKDESGDFSGPSVGGKLLKKEEGGLTFSSCTHTTTVIAPGSLFVTWTSGTNGTVKSSGAEVTVQSTFFGASAVCKTGEGTNVGTLTGVSSGSATIDISAKINCGILGTASWTGTYVTTGANAALGVVS
jgi:hypothetical protein